MAWRPARSLVVFHDQQKALAPRARPPGTPSSAWGTIGDALHDSTSDHAPKNLSGLGSQVVTAADSPHAPALGLDQHKIGESLRLSRDPRIKYWIFDGRMFSSYASGGVPAWTWRPYGGSDKHRDHSHLSVVGDARADGTQPWAIGGGDDLSEQAENILKAFAAGLPTANGGVFAPHQWQVRQDAFQAEVRAKLAADEVRDRTTQAMLTALTEMVKAGGGNIDLAALQQVIEREAAKVRGEVLAELDERDQRLADALAATGDTPS